MILHGVNAIQMASGVGKGETEREMTDIGDSELIVEASKKYGLPHFRTEDAQWRKRRKSQIGMAHRHGWGR